MCIRDSDQWVREDVPGPGEGGREPNMLPQHEEEQQQVGLVGGDKVGAGFQTDIAETDKHDDSYQE